MATMCGWHTVKFYTHENLWSSVRIIHVFIQRYVSLNIRWKFKQIGNHIWIKAETYMTINRKELQDSFTWWYSLSIRCISATCSFCIVLINSFLSYETRALLPPLRFGSMSSGQSLVSDLYNRTNNSWVSKTVWPTYKNIGLDVITTGFQLLIRYNSRCFGRLWLAPNWTTLPS